ncbi:hypothetical protein [Planctomicrobium sp. SH664]|uniref:hypothetical protein n=1 Tax=Planctomicrobium sp. SH664 TaxID=3448125 RepID=UPI003F5B0A15
MTRYSKILAIFIAAASLAFVGFAIATTFGGPNWTAITQSSEFNGYRFTRTDGPEIVWTATRAGDEKAIGSSRRLPEVISKVLDDIAQQQQAEIQQLQPREEALTTRIELLGKAIASDKLALDRYEAEQRERLSTLRAQETALAAQVMTSTAETQKLQNIIAARREDIFRLRQQAAELKTDEFRLTEIQQQLDSLLIQTQGNADRAELRNQLLKQQVSEK